MSKRHQKKLFSIFVALVLVGLGYASEANPSLKQKLTTLSPGTYRVTAIHDGDTIDVQVDGQTETVRFIGVDTPETHDPRKAVQCFGKAASQYTKDLIGSQAVRLEADPLSSKRDRYNRLLRYIYLPDGRLVQAEIIKNGYGFAYTSFPFTKIDEFTELQRQARQQNLGLWQSCNPSINKYGGYTSPDAN